jgi:diphthamide biosynthesis protein 3
VAIHLQKSALLLSKIVTAADSNSNATPDVSKLVAQGNALQESISSQTMSIALTRNRVTELSDQTHTAYRELFEASVRVIEQTLHGSVARGVKAKAEHLAVVSKGMELKLQ